MLIPLGDDLEKRELPLAALAIIGICLVIHLYSFRLTLEGAKTGEHLDREFIYQWALIPEKLPEGDFLGLATHMFLHGDWFHILGNLLMLWVFAGSLEHGLGSARFVVLYLFAGLAGGLAHVVMNPGSPIPMIGASGAIFGVIGAYFIAFGAMANIRALLIMRYVRKVISIPAGAYVFIWILIEQMLGIALAQEGERTGTAWYAHAGGFTAGAASMLFLKDFVKSRMALNREGKLEFVESSRPAAMAVASQFAEAASLPCECPHCQTPLADENKLSDELYRCPNAACKRLVYPACLTA